MDYKKAQLAFFIIITLIAATLVVLIFLPYLAPLVFAGTLAIVFRPMNERIIKQTGLPAWIAALITVISALTIVLLPLVIFGTFVLEEARGLYLQLATHGSAGITNRITDFIQERYPSAAPLVVPQVAFYVREAAQWFVRHLGPLFSGIAQGVVGFFVGALAFYYMIKDGARFKKLLAALSPLNDTYDQEIFSRVEATVNTTIKGALVVALIQGALAGVGFAMFGVPNPALWGAVTVLAALIPAVGTGLVMVPAVLYLFLTGSIGAAIGLLVWGGLLVGLIDNVLRPKLIERGIHVHPFLILISVLGGIEFFGPVGFLLGPVLLSLLFALLAMSKKQMKDYQGE